MTAVLTRRPKRHQAQRLAADLREQAYNGAPLKIDRDKGVIYGVKVLGRFSPNTHGQPGAEKTEYSQKALQECADFINAGNGSVKIDHPQRGNVEQARSVYETLGVLRNASVTDDGTRADFHYYATHELTPRVLEDVEKALGQYGLSINGRGDGTVRNGVYVIESLTELRSVDLVDRPATNRNLWESRESKPMKTTARKLIESLSAKLSKSRRQWAARLLEDGDMAPAMDAPVDDTPSDPAQALKDGFDAAIMAVLNDDSMDAQGKAKKISALLKTHEKLSAADEPEPPAQEEDGDDHQKKDEPAQEADEDQTDKKMESIRNELDALKAKDACRDLCESLGFTPTKDQLAALIEIRSPGIRKSTAEAFRSLAGHPAAGSGGPRSRSFGRPVTESRETTTRDAKAFAASLLN